MDHSNLSCDDAEEGARVGLLGLMTGLSEELWCAGWLVDLEFILWFASHGDAAATGSRAATPRQAELLRLLSDEAGGWWVYGKDGPVFLQTEEWLRRLEQAPRRDWV